MNVQQRIVSTTWSLLAILLHVANLASAREVLVMDGRASSSGSAAVVAIDPESGEILEERALPEPLVIGDLEVDARGWIYGALPTGWGGHLTRSRSDLSEWQWDWAEVPDPLQMAIEASGFLLVVDSTTALRPESSVFRVDPGTGEAIELFDSPGLDLFGLAVPKAGPFENGLLLLGAEPAPLYERYYVVRFRRALDGSLEEDSRFGPLDELLPWGECVRLADSPGGPVHQLVARPDGESFLLPEGCTRRILEYDLEGRFMGTVATLPEDPTLTVPGFPGFVESQWIDDLHVDSRGDLWVNVRQRVWHLRADGTPVRRIDRLFRHAGGIVDTEWVPFASEGTCAPKSLGYWKRQCLSEGTHPRRSLHGRAREAFPGSVPGLHPSLRPDGASGIFESADASLSDLGLSACEALWPESPTGLRARALAKWAAVACNRAAKRLRSDCECRERGATRPAGELMEEVREQLERGDAADWSLVLQHSSRLLVATDGGEE